MSNKLAKAPSQNGHAPPKDRERPSFKTSAGYTLHYRPISPDILPRLHAAARAALAGEHPPVPKQSVETGPGQWSEVENPHDETYQQAVEVWEARVRADEGQRFMRFCEEYALIYEIDVDEVQALRAAHTAIGASIDDLSDAHVFLWMIAMPEPEVQLTLFGKLMGGLTEEAIQAQKAAFLGNVSRYIAQAGA
jgi:hypothetical protein